MFQGRNKNTKIKSSMLNDFKPIINITNKTMLINLILVSLLLILKISRKTFGTLS